jgi:hypothetical protein
MKVNTGHKKLMVQAETEENNCAERALFLLKSDMASILSLQHYYYLNPD